MRGLFRVRLVMADGPVSAFRVLHCLWTPGREIMLSGGHSLAFVIGRLTRREAITGTVEDHRFSSFQVWQARLQG